MEAFRRLTSELRLAWICAVFSFVPLPVNAQTETAPAATEASAPQPASADAETSASPSPTSASQSAPTAREKSAPAATNASPADPARASAETSVSQSASASEASADLPAAASAETSASPSPTGEGSAPPAQAGPNASPADSTPVAADADAPKPAHPGALKIGVIGAGNIGGTLAALWATAGHEVMISSRHPERLQTLAARIGENARVGTPREAAAFADVVLIAVPYAAMPQVGRDYASVLAGKVVLDSGNPYPARDGDMAFRAKAQGVGLASQEFLPGVKLVRAFNAIRATDLRTEAHRETRVAIPIASDFQDALDLASKLVRDAGFDPVVVGDLVQSRIFDVNVPAFVRLMSGPELKSALGIKSAGPPTAKSTE